MSLILNMKEMFSNELFVFEHLKPDPGDQSVLSAGKCIIQAMETYDPYSFDNEETETKLEEIYSLLKGQQGFFPVFYRSFSFLLRGALEKNRGDWTMAGLWFTFAIFDLGQYQEKWGEVWSYFLLASAQAVKAQNKMAELDLDKAICCFKNAQGFYSTALWWLAHHMDTISDSRLKIKLYKRILYSYQRAGLELAEVYRRKNPEKEIEALYDALLYLIALINQSTKPDEIEEYRKDLFALYSTIAAFYERSEEFEKAIEVYKKASFLFSTMDLKKPDDWPSHWKEVFDALSSLYTQLGNTALANHNRFSKEQFSRQREQAETDL